MSDATEKLKALVNEYVKAVGGEPRLPDMSQDFSQMRLINLAHAFVYASRRTMGPLLACAEALEVLHARYLLIIGNEGPEALQARAALTQLTEALEKANG